MKNTLVIVLAAMLAFSCAAIKKRPADEFRGYSEDLSETRKTFPELPNPADLEREKKVAKGAGAPVDDDLDRAIESFVRDNKEASHISGFTILIYSGVDREKAFESRNDLYSAFPDAKADMQYQQPRYLVKVGQYINRIEAQSLYHKLKDKFPTARIIQDRFEREGAEEDAAEFEEGR